MDEVEAGAGDDGDVHGLLVADPFGEVTIDVETDDGTNLGAILDTGLPCGRDTWVAFWIEFGSELLTEGIETE